MWNDNIFILITIVCTLLVVLILIVLVLLTKKHNVAKDHSLMRSECNPIIYPNSWSGWESEATFNPGAFMDDDGRVHLIYRAIGGDGLSRLGYASSDDGINFNARSSFPIFEPTRGYGMPDPSKVIEVREYNPSTYTSGGGWGGSEDPRTVLIGDKVYLMYVAFEGWDSIRIALTSISLTDLKKERWNWKKPILISPKNERNKNWLLFPEKINGKYAILHGITPEILIDYVDDIDSLFTISSKRPDGPQPGREDFWDSKLRGAGAPPLLTPLGWLLLYHAIDDHEPHKYKLGAMILDKDNPTKILYRSHSPILSPDMHYENDSKPGIVYASGAVIKNSKLMVYYGGGDKHVCTAQTNLNEFLSWIKVNGKV